jgi:hypothetical protein
MTLKSESETDTTDNGTPTGKVDETGSTDTGKEPEKGTEAGTPDESTEEGRLKFLRSKLDEATAKVKAFETADEERKRADMSEGEKLKADLEALRSENAELRRKAIAAEFGLDEDLAGRLRGDTPEELAEDAKALAEKLGSTKKPAAPPAKDVGLGAPSKGDEMPSDPVAAYRKAMAAHSI